MSPKSLTWLWVDVRLVCDQEVLELARGVCCRKGGQGVDELLLLFAARLFRGLPLSLLWPTAGTSRIELFHVRELGISLRSGIVVIRRVEEFVRW